MASQAGYCRSELLSGADRAHLPVSAVRRTSPLILGGGPAGCAAATLLARAGAKPLVLERTRAPQDIVCGGFLSADTVGLLEHVGLSASALGAHPITRLRVIAGERVQEMALPFMAFGLSRRTLDAALLAQAGDAGAGIERGVTLKMLDRTQRRVHLNDGSTLSGDTIMLGTGKHDLRGALRPPDARGSDPAVGLRARLAPSTHLSYILNNVIELHVFPRGYAGLLLLEDGAANLCLSVSRSHLAAARSPAALVAALARTNPLLGDRLAQAHATGPWASIANIPYGWRAEPDRPGIFRLGDQGAVIASLAGDGIGIALASGCMAASAWQRGGAEASARFQSSLSARTRLPLQVAGGLKWLAERPYAHGPLLGLMAHMPALARLAITATRVVTNPRP
ncbi:FAD-dependent monooxygenase [Sphingobium sp. DEHP117]|uniref:NAD(P)/FAD-dependent oxidoreductase n=1 Tax=Sphingobium sp. DEHP117 TaxID=2993436 RepID=UPI0027D73ED4|nr:FAD-dependent monooxygenase [Sphingobium sp. DEHP117]MDQ4419452.1 FAD-dependent monooxygenase [Sphingobium sp. DEHP117]